MQRYTIFFIIVNAVHVSGGFSAHHQELKNCTQHLVYVTRGVYSFGAPGEGRRNRPRHIEH
jgi:hypothetical protein